MRKRLKVGRAVSQNIVWRRLGGPDCLAGRRSGRIDNWQGTPDAATLEPIGSAAFFPDNKSPF